MTYLSLFSGIEAASSAWHSLGWTPVAFSEIEPFPCAVLAHHYPDVPNYGDVTKHKDWPHADVDVVVGGSPCQAFSVAGLRRGLDDPRGNLTLTYLAVVEQYRPRWVVWENVPGVLSIDGGRVFGAFLGALGKLGYGFAYRVLDAQYVRVESHPRAVPQRRRRVFVVGCLGSWQRAAAVLFERESLRRHTPPRREAGKGIAADTAPCIGASGRGFERTGETRGQDPVVVSGTVPENGKREIHAARMVAFGEYADDGTASSLKRRDYKDATDLVAHSLRAGGFDASEDGTGRGTPLVTAFDCKASGQSGFGVGEVASTMRSMGHFGSHQNGGGHQAVAIHPHVVGRAPNSGPQGKEYLSDGSACTQDARGVPQAVAFSAGNSANARSMGESIEHSPPLRAAESGTNQVPTVAHAMHVRRLTPRECERLQGFPDDYTLVPFRGKPASDGPRYKALGNSMAVNVMRWIGERIQTVEEVVA